MIFWVCYVVQVVPWQGDSLSHYTYCQGKQNLYANQYKIFLSMILIIWKITSIIIQGSLRMIDRVKTIYTQCIHY